MKSVYGQWVQRGVQSLNSLLMRTSRNRRNKLTTGTSSSCKETAPNRKQTHGDVQNNGGFASTAVHSSAKSVYGQCPPFKKSAGERKLKQPLFGGQLEAVSKTAVAFQSDRLIAVKLDRTSLFMGSAPSRRLGTEEGERKLKQPLCPCLRRRVGIASKKGRDDPT